MLDHRLAEALFVPIYKGIAGENLNQAPAAERDAHSRLISEGVHDDLPDPPSISVLRSLSILPKVMRFTAHMRAPMSGSTTMPQSVFSLRTSAFNDFLYAPIGEEDNGMILTALSALARLGVDPWDEAARLSEQSKESATRRLTSIISGLPHGQWAASSAGDIAARLSALLPDKQAPVAQQAMTRAKHLPSPATAVFLFIFLINAVAFFAIREHAQQPTADPGAATSSTTVPPQVPSP